MAKNISFINSKYVEFKNAKIHVEDRGLQFGDSVYEVICVLNKKLIDLKFHFKRLRYSLKELDIKYNFVENNLNNIFKKLIDSNSIINGIIYLQVTRGVQKREHAYTDNLKPTIIIYSQKNKSFNLPNKKIKGVNVITHDDTRWARRDIKTTNLLPNILAEKKARKMNAYTAILIKNNKVTEGCHSNIWIVKNKKISTHPSNTDILKGVTRTSLKMIIKNFNLQLNEKSFTKKQLLDSDEVFLTSSTSFVTPVIKVDKKLINDGKIGHITLKLADLYLKSVNR